MDNYFQKACDNLRLEGLCMLDKENDSLRSDNSKLKKRLELAEKYLGEQGLSLDAYIRFHSEG